LHSLQTRKPDFQTNVYDYAKVLSASESTIRRKAVQYADSTTTQIVFITIESLKGEDIVFLTQNGDRNGNRWN
jgi:uncharacterized protein